MACAIENLIQTQKFKIWVRQASLLDLCKVMMIAYRGQHWQGKQNKILNGNKLRKQQWYQPIDKKEK